MADRSRERRVSFSPPSRDDLKRAVDKMRDTLSTKAQEHRVSERTWELLKTYDDRSQSFKIDRDDLLRYFKRSKIASHFSGRSFPLVVPDMSSRSGGARGETLEIDPTRGSTHLSAALTDHSVKTTAWEDGKKIVMHAHLDLYPELTGLQWEDFGPDAFDKFAAYVAEGGDTATLSVRFEDIEEREHRREESISRAFGQASRDNEHTVIEASKRGNGFTAYIKPPLGSTVALLHFGDHFIPLRSLPTLVSLTLQIHPEALSETSTSGSVGRAVRGVLAELGKLLS